MIRLLLLVALTGCFSKPGLTPSDASGDGADGAGSDGSSCVPSQPSPAGLTMNENAQHEWTVHIPNNSSIRFADSGNRYPFPIAIDLGNEQLVPIPSTSCGREDAVGVSAFPLYTIAGNQTPTTNIHPFDREIVGPAYTQVLSNWVFQHTAPCTSNGQFINGFGHTRWSFFPDGRVIRNDTIQPATNGTFTLPDTGCICSGGGGVNSFIVNGWVAVADEMVSQLTAHTSFGNDVEGMTTVPTMPGNDIQDAFGVCLRTPAGNRLAFWWEESSAGRRDTRVRFFVDELAFVNDIVALTENDMSLTSSDSYGARTQMLLESGNPGGLCTTANDKLASHAGQAAVTIDGDLTQIHGFGYFDDTQDDTRARDAAVTLQAGLGRVEGGFTVKIRFPGFRSITTEVAATWQHEEDDDDDNKDDVFFIFFPNGVSEDQEIVITPECRD